MSNQEKKNRLSPSVQEGLKFLYGKMKPSKMDKHRLDIQYKSKSNIEIIKENG